MRTIILSSFSICSVQIRCYGRQPCPGAALLCASAAAPFVLPAGSRIAVLPHRRSPRVDLQVRVRLSASPPLCVRLSASPPLRVTIFHLGLGHQPFGHFDVSRLGHVHGVSPPPGREILLVVLGFTEGCSCSILLCCAGSTFHNLGPGATAASQPEWSSSS